MSLCFFLNWIVDYGITRATPHMLRRIGWCTFLLFSALTYAGVVFIFFCLPELKGRSIESMDDLFERPLWTMWKCAYPSEEEKVRHGVQQAVMEAKWEEEERGRGGLGVRVGVGVGQGLGHKVERGKQWAATTTEEGVRSGD